MCRARHRLAFFTSLQLITKENENFGNVNLKRNLSRDRNTWKVIFERFGLSYTLFGFDTIAYSLLLKTLCCGPLAILPLAEVVSGGSVFFRIIP